MSKKHTIAITIGDPCGIGPEIVIKALYQLDLSETEIRLIGHPCFVEQACSITGLSLPPQVSILSPTSETSLLPMGKICKEAGKHSFDYLNLAIDLALSKQVQAIVTAPINKTSWHLAGINYPGHTEVLEAKTDTQAAMGFYSPDFSVVLATIHESLANVPRKLTKDGLTHTLLLAQQFAISIGSNQPIAVCGLNPHAGENGLFGDEEQQLIKPAIDEANRQGGKFVGPLPSDTVFHQAYQNNTHSIVVAMYHDQGLAPFKMINFDSGVNITLGLPFIRTSPDHGTAFDLAGNNTARPDSMLSAIRLAMRMIVK